MEALDGTLLGIAIRKLRRSKRPVWSQKYLAEKAAGVSPSTVAHLETGRIGEPTEETADALARALGYKTARELLLATTITDDDRRQQVETAGDWSPELVEDVIRRAATVALDAMVPDTEDNVAARVERLEEALQRDRERLGIAPIHPVAASELASLDLLAVVSAGPGAGSRVTERVRVQWEWIEGRRIEDLFAVTAAGTCMEPAIRSGDVLICERVYDPDQAPSSFTKGKRHRYVVWIDGPIEDIGGNVKYVERLREKARLTADDGTSFTVDARDLHIVGLVVTAVSVRHL